MMKKTIVAGTIALTLAGAGFALAQQAAPQEARDARASRLSAEDVTALTDARIASLKAGLKLTAEQEKNWPAVETAMRDMAKERADRMAARRGGDNAQQRQSRPDAMARLRQGADAMTTRAASLKKLADAAEPLYKSLDDGQKRRFAVLLHMGGRPGGHSHWQRRGDNVR
jgi:hypothetical protein